MKIVMRFIKNIRAVSATLNVAFIVAATSVVAIEVYFSQLPEVIPYGEAILEIYYRLCLSIIASYIFYFIVVHMKSQNDKENIYAFVASKSYNIVGDYKAQINALKKAAGWTCNNEYFSDQDISKMFGAINPNGVAPLQLGQLGIQANWIQFMDWRNNRTREFIKKIFVKIQFLESEFIKLLSEIDDCSHFSHIDGTVNVQVNNTDMKPWSGLFYEYSMKCKSLEEYNDAKLLQYKP